MKRRVKAKENRTRILQEDTRNCEEPFFLLKIGKPPLGEMRAAHPILSGPICTACGQSRASTSHPCGLWVVNQGYPGRLAPPASPAGLCCSYHWLLQLACTGAVGWVPPKSPQNPTRSAKLARRATFLGQLDLLFSHTIPADALHGHLSNYPTIK